MMIFCKYVALILLVISCGGGAENSGVATASTNPSAVIGDSLSKALAPHIPADNFGVGSSSTVDMIAYIQDKDLTPYTKIYVMAGINDLVAYGWTVENILVHYSSLLDVIRSKTKAVIYVQSTLPIDDLKYNKEILKLNKGLQVIVNKKGMKYVDLWVLLIDLDTGSIIAEKSIDGTHLTEYGYGEWADYISQL